MADHLEDHAARHALVTLADASASAEISRSGHALVKEIKRDGIRLAAPLIDRIEIAPGRVSICLNTQTLANGLSLPANDLAPSLITIDAPFTCRRRGVEMKIIAGEKAPLPDAALLRALRNAHRWSASLRDGTSLRAIAKQDGFSESYVTWVIPLACLSPRIQKSIVVGNQPVGLTLENLVRTRLPVDWSAQETMFGFSA